MEAPKFVMCPECDERYNDSRKRRIIDSCGHPRCFSCLFVDKPCPVCEKLLSGRPRSFLGSRESLLSADGEEHGSQMFTKEQYLRTLYSYDPNSEEHFTRNVHDADMRRRSLDSHMSRFQRKMNLGLHSNSSSVLESTSPKSHLPLNVCRQLGYEYGAKQKRNSLPLAVVCKNGSENQHPFSQSLLQSCNSSDFSGSELSSSSMSPGSSMMKFFDETDEPSGGDNDASSYCKKASRRSSGYWSESYNEKESRNSTKP